MKEEEYIMGMLKRAITKQGKAKKNGDELNLLKYSCLVRNLKIVLDIENQKGGKNRLKKTIDYNNSLI